MSERVEVFSRLGACYDALDWLADHAHLSDREAWEACDDPDWLLFALKVGGLHDPATLREALRPIWRTRRFAHGDAMVAREQAFDSLGAWDDGGWAAADLAHIEACSRADLNACSMIRHTVAMPTRAQLEAAVHALWEDEHGLPF